MNRPDIYRRANEVQRHDAEQIIKEYFSKIKWRSDGKDSLIDIGSGSGDVLFDFIYPRLTCDFEKIVCSDTNQKMMECARASYSAIDKSEFVVLNIETDKGLPVALRGNFDHVTSFYCLHWIRNQRQALKNIYDLLGPDGGDCLLFFIASVPVYDVYYKVRKSPKWFPYMKDIERFTSPLHSSKDPEMELNSILNGLEFSDYHVEIKEKLYVYRSMDIFRDNMRAINPYLDRVPAHLQQEFMDDFIEAAIKLDLGKPINNGEDYEFPIPYKLAVIYAEKYSTLSSSVRDPLSVTKGGEID